MPSNSTTNPKLTGTNIVDCIPQKGQCPNGCPECLYNRNFYLDVDKDLPLLPDPNTVNNAGRIVRVNSGHDSNINRAKVLRATRCYRNRFYNTVTPDFDFRDEWGHNWPVVFTCNGGEPHFVDVPDNVMFVRIRMVCWWADFNTYRLIGHYVAQGVPVVLTFMRYAAQDSIPGFAQCMYEETTHVSNTWWCPKDVAVLNMMQFVHDLLLPTERSSLVSMCGRPWSSFCRDCRHCEHLYWECLRRIR